MKRRAKKVNVSKTYAEESSEDQEGSADDSSIDMEPQEKKRKTKGKKEVSLNKKSGTLKRKQSKGRKSKSADPEEENGKGLSDDEDEEVVKSNSSKKKARGGRKSKGSASPEEENGNGDITEEDTAESTKNDSAKERKSRDDSGDEENEEDSEQNSEEYEVESVLDEKTVKGVRYYLIRWKGYDEDSDTWEPASTLNCPEAIQEYKKKKTPIKESQNKSKKSGKSKKAPEPVEDWNENDDFEVVRILDVHFRRDGKREFLVAWKGYSQKYDSWEPEENMNCKDLIEKFLKKCEAAKEANPKELRIHRKTTDRFTLSTKDTGRRLSKRNQGKQRIHYHDAE